MEEIYSNLNNPAGIGSIDKLYKETKKIDPKITRSEVKKFLRGKPSYTLNKVTKNRFQRRQFIFPKPGHTIISDVAYVKYYQKYNKPFLLVMIDGYSRYASVFPLSSLKSREVTSSLNFFFENSIYKFSKLLSDSGQEFTNRSVQKLLREKFGIEQYSTFQRDIKASIVERFIKTLKDKITRFVVEFNSENFSDRLQDIVRTYNFTPHRSLMYKKPIDVFLMTDWNLIKNFSITLFKKRFKKIKSVGQPLSPGTVVRIKNSSGVFKRTYHLRNSYELFRIHSVNESHVPVTYNIQDLDGENISGIFYTDELIPVEDSGMYDIQVLKERRRKGRVEYLIRYVHFPNSKEEWVKKSMLEKL